MEDRSSDSSSENYITPPSSPPRDSYNISIITSLSTDILPFKSYTSASINSSGSKPSYAAIVAKSLRLPPPATVVECSSSPTPSLLENDSHPAMGEGLKLSSEESSKSLTDGSSSPQLQGSQSPPSPLEKQEVIIDDTLPMPTNHQQELATQNGPSSLNSSQGKSQSAVHAATAGSRNSSLSHNTQKNVHPRSGYGSQHYHRAVNQYKNTHKSFYGRNMHMRPNIRVLPISARPPLPPPLPPFAARLPWLPPLRPSPSLASYSYTQCFPQPPMPSYGVYYEFPNFGSHFPYHATPITPLNPYIPDPYVPPSIRPYSVNVAAHPDPELHAKIVKQIEYYFSFPNLVKDTYLRRQMDDEGWVPIGIVAGFPEVKKLTSNIKIVKDALQASSVIEISGDKIRPVDDDPKRWVLTDAFKHFLEERSKGFSCTKNQADNNQSPEDN